MKASDLSASGGLVQNPGDDSKVLKMRTENKTIDIITLDSKLGLLKKRFNADSDKIRFLALLSPTCPL
jgi:hypothetical protein